MQAALCETVIEGINHTALFQADLMGEEGFEDGSYTTEYLAEKGARDA